MISQTVHAQLACCVDKQTCTAENIASLYVRYPALVVNHLRTLDNFMD